MRIRHQLFSQVPFTLTLPEVPHSLVSLEEYLAWLGSPVGGQRSYIHTKRHFIGRFGEKAWNENQEAVKSMLIQHCELVSRSAASMKVVSSKIDIYSFPDAIPEENMDTITIGDLHGNTIKLTYFLFRHGVLAFKKSVKDPAKAYEAFVEAYELAGQISETHVRAKRAVWGRSKDIKRHSESLARHAFLSTKMQRTAAEESDLKRINTERVQQWLQNAREEHDAAQKELDSCRTKLPVIMAAARLFINRLEVHRKKTLVRLIGDELADRGSNDWLTLLVLQFLYRGHVRIVILISNHGQEFVSAYESWKNRKVFEPKNDVVDEQKISFIGLKLLLEENLVTMHELTHLVQSAYLPVLRALDYSLHPEGIRIYSHAPIGLETVRHTANIMRVNYKDSTREELASVIDKINTRFARRVYEYSSDKCCDTTQINAPNYMTEQEREAYPLAHIIWNRWTGRDDTESARPRTRHGYQVNYVHGHDTYQSQFAHVVNLDTACGKGSRAKRRKDAKEAMHIIGDTSSNERLKLTAQRFLDNHCIYKVALSNEPALSNTHHRVSDIEAEYKNYQKRLSKKMRTITKETVRPKDK